MSFVISVFVREGIVMAADSRLTLNAQQQVAGQNITHVFSVSQSDSNQKLFVTNNGVGISTVGAAAINGVPIAGFIEQFVVQVVGNNDWPPEKVTDEIVAFFHQQAEVPQTKFHVAGYIHEKKEQQIFSVDVASKMKYQINGTNSLFGASWDGEVDVMSRILNTSAEIDKSNGNLVRGIYPSFDIHFPFFTLQDAIDFSIYAVRTTIDTIRFQARPKSVGGPIDVLVIKPNEVKWIKRKELDVKEY